MIVLLDENFPLGLLRSLQADAIAAEHIIPPGWRGASDTRIRDRLHDDQVLFLTQDDDFLYGMTLPATIVVSRVRQSRQLAERIQIWRAAIRELFRTPRSERLFELMDDGALVPWRDVPPD